MMNVLKKVSQIAAFSAFAFLAGQASADVSVEWTSPADGTVVPVGTEITLEGTAGAEGTIGDRLELVLVLDSSGSMRVSETVNGVRQTRREWQAEAAIALVNSLPESTAVSIVEFDSDANTVTTLTALGTDRSSTIAAINSVDSSGLTDIRDGINEATAVLTGADHVDGSSQQMIVFSDGVSSLSAAVNATRNAISSGVEAVHTVALPGASVNTLQSIANETSNVNGQFVDARNDISGLIAMFEGQGGNLVGVDRVVVTLPDGTDVEVAIDALGNYDLSAVIGSGESTFIVTAFGTDGTVATDTITIGTADVSAVPVPATLPLLATGLVAFFGMRRRAAKK